MLNLLESQLRNSELDFGADMPVSTNVLEAVISLGTYFTQYPSFLACLSSCTNCDVISSGGLKKYTVSPFIVLANNTPVKLSTVPLSKKFTVTGSALKPVRHSFSSFPTTIPLFFIIPRRSFASLFKSSDKLILKKDKKLK